MIVVSTNAAAAAAALYAIKYKCELVRTSICGKWNSTSTHTQFDYLYNQNSEPFGFDDGWIYVSIRFGCSAKKKNWLRSRVGLQFDDCDSINDCLQNEIDLYCDKFHVFALTFDRFPHQISNVKFNNFFFYFYFITAELFIYTEKQIKTKFVPSLTLSRWSIWLNYSLQCESFAEWYQTLSTVFLGIRLTWLS